MQAAVITEIGTAPVKRLHPDPVRSPEYPLASIHDAWTAQLYSPGAKIIVLPDA